MRDPQRYGVVEFDATGRADRPRGEAGRPRSPYAVTGLYFYDNRVLDIAASLAPSARGELEITDVNRAYLEPGELHVEDLGRGMAWLDTGTHEALLQASTFIQAIEQRQDLKVACPEEVALNMGYITADDVRRIGQSMEKNEYGQYLLRLSGTNRHLSALRLERLRRVFPCRHPEGESPWAASKDLSVGPTERSFVACSNDGAPARQTGHSEPGGWDGGEESDATRASDPSSHAQRRSSSG